VCLRHPVCYEHADITITCPSGGRFTEQQALVYNAVLDAHDAVVAAMAPGVSWPDMQVCVERECRVVGAEGGGHGCGAMLVVFATEHNPESVQPSATRWCWWSVLY
jgi:Xaa-Pro aminopeptidase